MKTRKKSIWVISGIAAAVVAVAVLGWGGGPGRGPLDDNRVVPGSGGLPSGDEVSAGRSEAGVAVGSTQASEWPGLPAAVSGQNDSVSPLQPEPSEDALAPALPLVELVDSFDELEAHQRGEAAYRIAAGWMDCRGSQALDDAALRAEAERIVENRERRLTEMAAHALEQNPGQAVVNDVEQAIGEFARTSRDARVAEVERELRTDRDFCRGADDPGYEERNLRYLHWLERAADLGHPAARIAFARLAFFWSETVSVGEAAELVERKRKVAGFLRQALAARNAEALLALAEIIRKGYYALPDPFLEYAYSQAAIRALSGDAPGWGFGSSDSAGTHEVNISILRGRIEKLEASLAPDERRRAERLSGRVLGPGDS